MHLLEDAELLRRYAEEKSEPAFGELVRRHLDLVYSVALRQVGGDAHLAEDVAQIVFTTLARKAPELTHRAVLGGWLYRTAQFTAIDVVRTESRRRAREAEVHTMHESTENSRAATDWEKLRPTLDQIVGELKDDDRDAVVLRFFEGKSFAEVGTRLRLTENAARMRVERALDKLHAVLARRGVTSTVAALGLALADQAAVAAPAGLAASVTSSVLGAAGVSGGAVAVATIMSMTKLKIGVAAAVLVAGAASIVVQQQTNARLQSELGGLHEQGRELARLRPENEQLVRAHREDAAELASLRVELTALKNRAAPEGVRAVAPSTKPAFTLATGLKPAGSFTNAGRGDTARAALETLQWATSGGNAAAIAEGLILPPDARQKAEELFAKLSADKRAEFGTPEQLIATLMAGTTQVAGMQVMSEKPGAPRTWGLDPSLATDPTYRTLHTQTQYVDGRVRENDVVFQQTSSGWRTVFPPGMVDKMGEFLKPVPANLKHDGGG